MIKRNDILGGVRGRLRTLRIEPLEERRILAASAVGQVAEALVDEAPPWQNPVYRLDVSNDGTVNSSDTLTIINRILEFGPGELDPPTEPVTTFYDTDGNNRLNTSDLLAVINGLLTAPKVTTSTLTTFTVDTTPKVKVTVDPSIDGTLPDGTIVYLDVDLNNDGDFSDPNEAGHTQSTIFEGESNFELASALPISSEVYQVRLQARVKDTRAVMGRSEVVPLVVDTLTSNALANYVNLPDPSYTWRVVNGNGLGEIKSIAGLGSYTYYAIDMTSQTWRSTEDVNLPVWRHWLSIYVPTSTISDSAVLLIDGGSNGNFTTPPAAISLLGQASLLLGSVFVHLKVVPNEPLIFTDETQSRTEDDIIAYTFDKYLENIGEPGNETWPVLLPMVKSAVRAMDTTQSLVPQVKLGASIDDFVVTGYSKRGWTTWLTAAVDDRVRAILPGVFDNLNQGPQMVHHYGAYGFFSEAVQPYNEMEVFDRILTPEGMQLGRIVDPYSYFSSGRFDFMPKLVINSAGDEFFVSDSAQFYFDDIPGDRNYLIYLPNTGHGLDIDLDDPNPQQSKVGSATITFVDAILNNRVLPKYSWTVEQNGAIRVVTDTQPLEVKLWQATNPNERDFRHFFHGEEVVWTSTTLNATEPGVYVGNVAMPDSGARGYFVELTYASQNQSGIPIVSDPYVFTTEIRVKSTLPLHPWPFESAFETLPLVATPAIAAASDATRNAVASALAIPERETAVSSAVAAPLASPLADSVLGAIESESEELLIESVSESESLELMLGDDDWAESALDSVLSELLA